MESGSFFQRLFRRVWRVSCRQDWLTFVDADWPEQIMTVEVTDRFHAKQGRSTGRWVLRKNGQLLSVYLKRHYRLPWWHGLLATLWPSRNYSPAMQEATNLTWAQEQGLQVPDVVAVGECIGPCGGLQSVLAVEELHDMLPLHEAIPLAASQLDAKTFAKWKRSLIKEIARLARLLHQKKYFHKDLYLCHFYIARTDTLTIPDWHNRVYLIDLHRLAHHRVASWIWQSKDLAQLLYSSELDEITAKDRQRFWHYYFGEEESSTRKKWLKRLTLYRWRRYRRHNEKRKQREQERKAA